MKTVDCDYFVVGSGMAGLMSALHLASYGRVVLATKERLQDCNTNFAQGGICCVADPADSFENRALDHRWLLEHQLDRLGRGRLVFDQQHAHDRLRSCVAMQHARTAPSLQARPCARGGPGPGSYNAPP